MPTLDRIAKTIVGPNEAHNISPAKLIELQDLKWGRLKSQEQAHMLRAAGFIKALYDAEATHGSNGAPVASRPPPLPKTGDPAPPAPTALVLDADARSTEHLLQQLRAFVMRNCMTWLNGAGDHHHPLWQDVATELDMYDLNFTPNDGPDYEFIQPLNRKPYTVLVAEYVEAKELGG